MIIFPLSYNFIYFSPQTPNEAPIQKMSSAEPMLAYLTIDDILGGLSDLESLSIHTCTHGRRRDIPRDRVMAYDNTPIEGDRGVFELAREPAGGMLPHPIPSPISRLPSCSRAGGPRGQPASNGRVVIGERRREILGAYRM